LTSERDAKFNSGGSQSDIIAPAPASLRGALRQRNSDGDAVLGVAKRPSIQQKEETLQLYWSPYGFSGAQSERYNPICGSPGCEIGSHDRFGCNSK